MFAPTRVDVLATDNQITQLGIIGSGFTAGVKVDANGLTFSNGNGLTIHGTSLLTFSMPTSAAKATKQVLVTQPQARPKLLQYPAPAPPKPAVTSVGAIAQGDSKWVAVAGANLASIRNALYDGKTPLQLEVDAGGSSLRIFVTAEITGTAGSKDVELSNPAGDKVSSRYAWIPGRSPRRGDRALSVQLQRRRRATGDEPGDGRD